MERAEALALVRRLAVDVHEPTEGEAVERLLERVAKSEPEVSAALSSSSAPWPSCERRATGDDGGPPDRRRAAPPPGAVVAVAEQSAGGPREREPRLPAGEGLVAEMTGAPAILPSKRDQWLAARRACVTASDVAAILGEDPRRGPLAVYASKVGEFEAEETLPMRRGRRLEGIIAAEYEEQTGRPVASVPEYELLFHPDVRWLAATLDRKVLATEAAPDPFGKADVGPARTAVSRARAPLQIKYALGSASHWKDEPPLAYAVQVTIEMACAGSMWGALCGMVGPGPLKTFDLPRNDGFLDAAIPRLEAFWLAVKRREPPEADGLPGTSEAIKRLWADEDGETIPLDREALKFADDLDSAKARVSAAGATVKELQNKLRARMGSASFGALPDGTYLKAPKRKRRAHEVEGSEFRVLERFWPRIRRR